MNTEELPPKKQIAEALPKERWQAVTVIESNKAIVLLVGNENMILANPDIKIRGTVAEMLGIASKLLPKELSLYVIEGIRSIEEQQQRWDRCYTKIKSEFPNKDEIFWEKQTGLLVARPLPLANHNCGGAVDVQLIYKSSGDFVDMGTPAQSGFGYRMTKMLSEEITEDQKHNRAILREVMEQVGFVWYPGEWWHYCYGDRMWAVYTGKTECQYGPIQNIKS